MIQGTNLRSFLDLGIIQINLYGITYAFSFLIVFFFLRRYLNAQKKDSQLVFTALIYLMIGTLVGARIFYILFYQSSGFLENPLTFLYFWRGGLSFHGGLLGGVLAGYLFCRKYRVDFLEVADALVLPVVFFLGFGRIVNFLNAELYGKISEVAWCVQFPGVEGCRHPSQLYAAMKDFALFFMLLILRKRKVSKGVLFLSFLFSYSLLRFFIDFFREYENIYLGLGLGQYLTLVLGIISGYFLFIQLHEQTGQRLVKRVREL